MGKGGGFEGFRCAEPALCRTEAMCRASVVTRQCVERLFAEAIVPSDVPSDVVPRRLCGRGNVPSDCCAEAMSRAACCVEAMCRATVVPRQYAERPLNKENGSGSGG